MTDDHDARLKAIAARAEAALPGPWRWMGNTATDQVYLATAHSGQLTILSPATRSEEYVHHHEWCETYTLGEARKRVIEWCGLHADDTVATLCDSCEEIHDFLRGELDLAEGRRDLGRDGEVAWLTRGLQIHPDLRLGVDGLLRSYRTMARYEVLGRSLADRWSGYRTKAEWEAEAGAVGGERAPWAVSGRRGR